MATPPNESKTKYVTNASRPPEFPLISMKYDTYQMVETGYAVYVPKDGTDYNVESIHHTFEHDGLIKEIEITALVHAASSGDMDFYGTWALHIDFGGGQEWCEYGYLPYTLSREPKSRAAFEKRVDNLWIPVNAGIDMWFGGHLYCGTSGVGASVSLQGYIRSYMKE